MDLKTDLPPVRPQGELKEEEGPGKGDQKHRETKKAGKEHQGLHQMKRRLSGLNNSSGIPHHEVTKEVAGLKGCNTNQDASQGETKDGAKKEGIAKRNQAKARGGAKKEADPRANPGRGRRDNKEAREVKEHSIKTGDLGIAKRKDTKHYITSPSP